ncbi:hypothetical protein BJ875DRAFT_283807 [Amylocarpus encephaloides]|uniref:INO80 complex subunit 3 N-terminal domain-containing protein n=1 Tax=Amylocarpus encephaloides TaxID=45428 RepID=A0A9P8C699_9HELO|nr:hypothetical protein BJ875DRAFT_283807 [Amylocarpus encephaloides]
MGGKTIGHPSLGLNGGDDGPVAEDSHEAGVMAKHVDVDDSKPTYKSFKKKFRKMRIAFDDKMRHSDDWYRREQKAEEQIKRLAQENE